MESKNLVDRLLSVFDRGGAASSTLGTELVEKLDRLEQNHQALALKYQNHISQVNTICPKMVSYLQYYNALTNAEQDAIKNAVNTVHKSCHKWSLEPNHKAYWAPIKNFRKFGHVAYKWLKDMGYGECIEVDGHNHFTNEKGALLLERLFIPLLSKEELDHFSS